MLCENVLLSISVVGGHQNKAQQCLANKARQKIRGNFARCSDQKVCFPGLSSEGTNLPSPDPHPFLWSKRPPAVESRSICRVSVSRLFERILDTMAVVWHHNRAVEPHKQFRTRQLRTPTCVGMRVRANRTPYRSRGPIA